MRRHGCNDAITNGKNRAFAGTGGTQGPSGIDTGLGVAPADFSASESLRSSSSSDAKGLNVMIGRCGAFGGARVSSGKGGVAPLTDEVGVIDEVPTTMLQPSSLFIIWRGMITLSDLPLGGRPFRALATAFPPFGES